MFVIGIIHRLLRTRRISWALSAKSPNSLPYLAFVHGYQSVEEHTQANHCRRDEHSSVPAQPCKVQPDLLPEVQPAEESKPSASGHRHTSPTNAGSTASRHHRRKLQLRSSAPLQLHAELNIAAGWGVSQRGCPGPHVVLLGTVCKAHFFLDQIC